MKIICVMGARPNFMKVAALYKAFVKYPEFSFKLLHTGQHHDDTMYLVFLRQLGLPEPDFCLGIHGGSHTEQTAMIMLGFEKVLRNEQPDMVIVVGDVNSSLACALVAAKEGVKLTHVESGLRSNDKRMPEELNRILIDHISDELFVSETTAVLNLQKENIEPDKVHFVGNVMIDSLVSCQESAAKLSALKHLNLKSKDYVLLTLHRPSNVDSEERLKSSVDFIKAVCKLTTVVFPVHPRTKLSLMRYGFWNELEDINGLHLLPPQGYLEFLNLMDNALMVITDSGGVQEETTYLRIPCVTLRAHTERPVTVEEGTNYLAEDFTADDTMVLIKNILNGHQKESSLPQFWDGFASERIVQVLRNKYIK